LAEHIDTLSRKDHLREFQRDYQPGMHVTLLGPTGRGKSKLCYQMLAVVTSKDLQVNSLHGKIKGRDPVVMSVAKQNHLRIVTELPSLARRRIDRQRGYHGYLIIPLSKPLGDAAEEDRVLRQAFSSAIGHNYRDTKHKTITHINEAHQTQVELKLKKECEQALMRGAPDNSMWSEAQRGRMLTYHTYGAPEYMIVFYDDDADNRDRYKDFGCADPELVKHITANLKTKRVADGRTISQALCIRRRGDMYIVDT
jgi:energy-coupling factor transporter ATP-binding protein EcfA2